jgi:FdhD protein
VSKAAAYRNVQRYQDGQWRSARRAIPEEAPIVIAPNGNPFAAVMASPVDLEDLALGFAVTEGLVENVSKISGIEVAAVDEGYEARLTIPVARAARLEDRRRAFAARTSYNLCGLEDLDSLLTRRPNARAKPTRSRLKAFWPRWRHCLPRNR